MCVPDKFTLFTSGVNGKSAYRILFCLGRNDKISKGYLNTSYRKIHYILGFLLVNILSKQ